MRFRDRAGRRARTCGYRLQGLKSGGTVGTIAPPGRKYQAVVPDSIRHLANSFAVHGANTHRTIVRVNVGHNHGQYWDENAISSGTITRLGCCSR